jgi:hypothetical protein
MSWLISAGGGKSMFDYYSITHIIWFIALTTILLSIFKKRTWMVILFISAAWEIIEYWIVNNLPWFPFTVGKENLINKAIGDPICDFIGFIIAWACIKSIRRW